MPDQACANGLQLYFIPDELSNMYPIERRVISFRIPFITLIVIRRYGGHYKVNGPPVNVPATLDQIVHILPRMPHELQLHPLKLKRKLEYKSHYMYDMIRKDKIIGAIMWLKEHNTHYSSIPIDTSWLENMSPNDISVLPSADSDTVSVSDSVNHKLSDSVTHAGAPSRTVESDTISGNCPMEFGTNKGEITTDIDADVSSHINLDNLLESSEPVNDDDSDKHELVEDQAAIDRCHDTMGDPLPTVVQFDSLENIIYNCAPGENNIPKYILLDDDFEVLAFPDLFPHGYGGYNSR